MDFFDKRVLATLKDGKPRRFAALLGEVGFSHNTLQQNLKRLMAKGLIAREEDAASGFGRPRFTHCIASKTAKEVAAALEDPFVELVTMPFSRLRHACRFEKGGYCKEKSERTVRLRTALKPENKIYNHFTPTI